jgi:hypothetical protein
MAESIFGEPVVMLMVEQELLLNLLPDTLIRMSASYEPTTGIVRTIRFRINMPNGDN